MQLDSTNRSEFESREKLLNPEFNQGTTSLPLIRWARVKGTPLFVGLIGIMGSVFLLFNNPEKKQIFPPDRFWLATGYYGPTCGATRATHALLVGDVMRAIQFNALWVATIPIILYVYVWWVTKIFTGKELPKIKITKKMIWIAIAIAVIFTIGRNFPGAVPEYFARGRLDR